MGWHLGEYPILRNLDPLEDGLVGVEASSLGVQGVRVGANMLPYCLLWGLTFSVPDSLFCDIKV